MRRRAVLWILLCSLSVELGFAQGPKPRMLPFPEVHLGPNGEGAEGAVWLSWSNDQQLFFVNGFLQGFGNGWKASCGKSSKFSKANVYRECVDARFQTEKPFAYYRNEATEFYTKYPEDLALPIDRLFSKLAEPGMTGPKVHDWLNDIVNKWKGTKSTVSRVPQVRAVLWR